jgi:hypothetical protein
MGEMENAHRISAGNPKRRDFLEYRPVDWRILKFILYKYGERVQTRFNWIRIGTSGGLL